MHYVLKNKKKNKTHGLLKESLLPWHSFSWDVSWASWQPREKGRQMTRQWRCHLSTPIMARDIVKETWGRMTQFLEFFGHSDRNGWMEDEDKGNREIKREINWKIYRQWSVNDERERPEDLYDSMYRTQRRSSYSYNWLVG